MMTFCKKRVHSFLRLSNSKDNGTIKSPCRCRNIPSPVNGLSFIAVTGDIQRPANVIESAVVKSTPSSPTSTTTATAAAAVKKDPGGIGFIDDVGGGVDGLMSCTESLGFESSDERRTDGQIIEEMNRDNYELCSRTRSMVRPKWRREVKKFPPPLSSMNKNGQPSFFLRAVRKDGRLELTEVRIDRPEILRASRQDGRLRLHLIRTEEEEEEEEEEEDIEEKIEEERIGEWNFLVTNGGDGFRRCYELESQHHHHHHLSNLHVWSQHCVTIR